MNKNELKNYVDQGLSTYKIAELVDKSHGSVRYWLEKFELQTQYTVKRENFKNGVVIDRYCEYTEYTCATCKVTKPISEFYKITRANRRTIVPYSYCKDCAKKTFKEYTGRKKRKDLAVEYKGGCCIVCGYKRCISALEFHHLDPSQKDFSFSAKNHHAKVSMEELKVELDKCVLLCSNCHKEVHAGLVKL